jgi:hypothetical protein
MSRAAVFSSTLNNAWVRGIALAVYYLAILAGLIWLYGKGDFSAPPFVYQGF